MHVGDSVRACPGTPCRWSALASDLGSRSFCCPHAVSTPAPPLSHGEHHRCAWARCPIFRPSDLGCAPGVVMKTEGGRTLKPRRGVPIDDTEGVVLTP